MGRSRVKMESKNERERQTDRQTETEGGQTNRKKCIMPRDMEEVDKKLKEKENKAR